VNPRGGDVERGVELETFVARLGDELTVVAAGAQRS
jgi:hypothetical protein